LTPVLQLTSLTHLQGFEGFEPVDHPHVYKTWPFSKNFR
jgi:hypothetical protein